MEQYGHEKPMLTPAHARPAGNLGPDCRRSVGRARPRYRRPRGRCPFIGLVLFSPRPPALSALQFWPRDFFSEVSHHVSTVSPANLGVGRSRPVLIDLDVQVQPPPAEGPRPARVARDLEHAVHMARA